MTASSRRVLMIAVCVTAMALAFATGARSESRKTIPVPPESARQPADPTEKTDYYDDGKIMARSKFTREGQLAEKHYYYHDGKLQKIERYDRAGNKIEEADFDEAGKLDDSINGWAAKRWLYKDGQLRVESAYGEDGHLTERLIYNEQGDLADRQYVGDGAIDPNEEFNRGSVVTKETDEFYDKYGNRTGSVTTEVDDLDDML